MCIPIKNKSDCQENIWLVDPDLHTLWYCIALRGELFLYEVGPYVEHQPLEDYLIPRWDRTSIIRIPSDILSWYYLSE